MNNDNVFFAVKAAFTAAIGAFGAAFGWLGWLVLAWVVCMATDWITGSMAAAKDHEWDSATARTGIWHKAGMIVVVAVAAMCDSVIGLMMANLPGVALPFAYETVILPVVLIWYIFTELGSIAENAVKMGAAVPAALVALLKAGRKAAETALPEADEESDEDEGVE